MVVVATVFCPHKSFGTLLQCGMIHYAGVVKRQNLSKAVMYIAKSSQFLMAKLIRRSRLFLRGRRPKEWVVVKGRPRQRQGGWTALH